MLVTNKAISNKDDVIKIARLYFSRWRIEEYFRAKKQIFDFENFRVRKLRAINALNFYIGIAMCFLAHMTQKCRKCIVEICSGNCQASQGQGTVFTTGSQTESQSCSGTPTLAFETGSNHDGQTNGSSVFPYLPDRKQLYSLWGAIPFCDCAWLLRCFLILFPISHPFSVSPSLSCYLFCDA